MGSASLVRLLLDTHIWFWAVVSPEKLIHRVVTAIEDAQNERWLSPVSIWELVILVEKRRIEMLEDIKTFVERSKEALLIREALLTHEVAIEMGKMHVDRDPADRLLVATARVFELTLVTADRRLIGTKGVSILANV